MYIKITKQSIFAPFFIGNSFGISKNSIDKIFTFIIDHKTQCFKIYFLLISQYLYKKLFNCLPPLKLLNVYDTYLVEYVSYHT